MSLHETYYECRELILDSPEVVEEVEKYRQDLKPKKVRIVLLAESHVHTTEKEFSKFLKKDYLHNDGTRCKYVRFVYCLGSSESKILEKPEPAVRRRGQFWRILYSCFHRINATSDFALFDGGSDEERLEQKIKLLGELKSNGIWLVDASIVGINVLNKKTRIVVMKKCWQGYVGQTLKGLKELEKVVVIGETVNQALSEDLKSLGVEVNKVPQPQAHIPGGYLPHYRKIFYTCQSHSSA